MRCLVHRLYTYRILHRRSALPNPREFGTPCHDGSCFWWNAWILCSQGSVSLFCWRSSSLHGLIQTLITGGTGLNGSPKIFTSITHKPTRLVKAKDLFVAWTAWRYVIAFVVKVKVVPVLITGFNTNPSRRSYRKRRSSTRGSRTCSASYLNGSLASGSPSGKHWSTVISLSRLTTKGHSISLIYYGYLYQFDSIFQIPRVLKNQSDTKTQCWSTPHILFCYVFCQLRFSFPFF